VSASAPSIGRRIGRIVPVGFRTKAKELWCRAEAARARRRWAGVQPSGPLDASLLPAFARRFPPVPLIYNYSPADTLARGLDRYHQVAPYAAEGTATLEVGSADGMTACALALHGRVATAIDIDTSRTDPRACEAGVRVVGMDATRLSFADASFDLVYSFNVFEHLPHPAETFAEITRVLRPGGVAFITFTGLRWSPHGAHLYKMIGVPYVTVLFEEADVLQYLRANGHTTAAPWVNSCTIEDFRSAFLAQRDAYATWEYAETRNAWHSRLIAAHAGVFKSRVRSFDSLLVDSVQLTCRKLDEAAGAHASP
jgi:SAM-dependent methyltransferase